MWTEIDLTELLGQVTTPTLVAHARGDMMVPFEAGRLLAIRIPNARFLPLDGRNHILLRQEPAWNVFLDEVRSVLGTELGPASVASVNLSARESEVLRLVADGLSNEEIAGQLVLSVRTVERHLSNIYMKLGVTGKAARAAAAARFTSLGQTPTGS